MTVKKNPGYKDRDVVIIIISSMKPTLIAGEPVGEPALIFLPG